MDLSNNDEAFGIKRQTIVFVRHGVARHNLLDDKGNPPNLNDPELFDPPLLLEGKKQAFDAGERLRIWWHTTQVGEHLELVITSPLTRCLQTTALAFLPGDLYAKDIPEPTIACMDLVREAYGMSYPDRRRPKDLLMVSFRHKLCMIITCLDLPLDEGLKISSPTLLTLFACSCSNMCTVTAVEMANNSF